MRTTGTAHTLRRMAAHADFANHCSELLSAAGTVQAKRMFGGWGLYIDGVFVAIVVGETLYLKTDDQTQERFVAAGGTRFEYTARGQVHTSGYWTPPPEAMDSPALMAPWARLALEAAVRAKAARPARRKPRSR
jgi:DNA transformation protein